MKALYISNGYIAWGITEERLARLYREGYYSPPEGWLVLEYELAADPDWSPGNCLEMRRYGIHHEATIEGIREEATENAGAGIRC